MALPEIEDEANKPKKTRVGPSKNKSLSRILEYAYHEPIIDLKFIGKMVTLYAQSLFQKVLNKSLYAAINPIKSIKASTKKTKSKNFIPEEKKLYTTIAIDKVYNLLLTNNSTQLEATKQYLTEYKERKKKASNK